MLIGEIIYLLLKGCELYMNVDNKILKMDYDETHMVKEFSIRFESYDRSVVIELYNKVKELLDNEEVNRSKMSIHIHDELHYCKYYVTLWCNYKLRNAPITKRIVKEFVKTWQS